MKISEKMWYRAHVLGVTLYEEKAGAIRMEWCNRFEDGGVRHCRCIIEHSEGVRGVYEALLDIEAES